MEGFIEYMYCIANISSCHVGPFAGCIIAQNNSTPYSSAEEVVDGRISNQLHNM